MMNQEGSFCPVDVLVRDVDDDLAHEGFGTGQRRVVALVDVAVRGVQEEIEAFALRISQIVEIGIF